MYKSIGDKLVTYIVVTVSVLLILCVLIKKAHGEPIYGQDFYAIQSKNWNNELAIRYNTGLKASGNISNTFGASLDSIRLLLTKVHPLYYRAHIWNTTCNTNGNCYPYELTYGFSNNSLDYAVSHKNTNLFAGFTREVRKYRDLSIEYPNTTFLISPGVEHHLSKKSWRILADKVKEVWPEIQLVNSPGAGVAYERYRNAWIELHGGTPPLSADIYSLDGTDATDIDINKYMRRTSGAKIVYFWSRSYNCRDQGPFEDPRKRTSCPIDSTFDLMAHIGDTRGPPPTFEGIGCRIIKPFKAPNIWKPLAEDKGNGDSRANKPVAIINPKEDKVRMLDYLGNTVGSLGFYGSYQGILYRYYSAWRRGTGEGGYEFERAAIRSSGNPYTFIESNKTCTGPIISGRRQGSYR